MGTKLNPGEFDCYHTARDDEPMFVLLARDKHAAALVNLWAVLRRMGDDETDHNKIIEAENCANAMVEWRTANRPDAGDVAGLRTLAEAVAAFGELMGVTVRIEQQSVPPLRMGGYVPLVTVTPRHSPGPFDWTPQ